MGGSSIVIEFRCRGGVIVALPGESLIDVAEASLNPSVVTGSGGPGGPVVLWLHSGLWFLRSEIHP